MPTVKVYGNKPDTGPKQMSANAARDNINAVHPTWHVTLVWTADSSKFTSATASETALETAVEAKFPGYQFVTT